ncbi:TonB-dependent siderophore receptor [Dyella caseinilytica]|uniref:TonB-dependent siderophore receptor n=1 Tax=Dyella caseinilytica TaxID=1849581 RepID=A0ABX7GXZ5_9GAMM|nr:TonB-dependent siderophore receptor [Dyella caseinilytica]QRN55200.1 TonB-dependent siderophore receptor [Dyella caseinilytica]GGA00094.1 ligand-gated channel [Dyella caseinilytica]
MSVAARCHALHFSMARRRLAVFILSALAVGIAHADDNDPQNAKVLDQVSVTATSAQDAYHATEADTGALGQRSLLDTPFSISAVTSDLIQNRQSIDINEAFAADPGVTPLSSGYSGESSGIAVRGLPVDLLNGYKMDGLSIPSWGTDLPLEAFSQIELLKGPGGFMYGFGAPGGIINFVSKQPTLQPYASFTLGYMNDGVLSEEADLGGTIGGQSGWGYRLNLVHEDGNTFVDDGHIRRNAASLALTKDITSNLHWHFNSIYQDRDVQGTYYGILLAPGVSTPAPLPGDQRVSQPYTGYQTTYRVANTGVTWDISPDWSFHLDYSYANQTRENHDSALTITDNQGTYTDLNYLGYSRYDYQQWQGMFNGTVMTGAIKHDLVFGASWQALDEHYPSGLFTTSQLLGTGNIFDAPIFPNPDTPVSHATYLAETTTQRALFASDTVTFSPQWSALLGLRYMEYIDTSYNQGSTTPSARYTKNPLTPTAAIMYKPIAPVTLYASYVQSLEQASSAPETAANAYQTFSPTISKQFEFGAKTEFDTWSTNLALFQVQRGLQYLNNDNVYVQNGQTRYQGIDFSAQTHLGQNWMLMGGVMYLDATNVQAAADVDGKRAYGAPRLQGNVYVEYSVPQVPGLFLTGGARYVGNEAVDANNSNFIGAYHTFDLGARYTTTLGSHPVTYRVGLDNLTNEKYWLTSWGFILNQGTPRTVRASVTFTL